MKTLYKFLHFLLSILFSLLLYTPYYFKLTKRRLWGSFSRTSVDDIKRDIATLKNLPRHISFLLLEPHIDFSILAQVVVWSVAAGISYISVFDPKGILKKKRRQFYEEVSRIREELLGSHYELYLVDKTPEKTMTNGTATENKSVRKAFLSVLSTKNGKKDIVKAAQMFCTSVNNKECEMKTMDVKVFSDLLEGNNDFPDPDVAIKFGHTDSLFGYLPWQIRLTEFISIPSLQVLDYKLFLNSLERYSRCEQRLGR